MARRTREELDALLERTRRELVRAGSSLVEMDQEPDDYRRPGRIEGGPLTGTWIGQMDVKGTRRRAKLAILTVDEEGAGSLRLHGTDWSLRCESSSVDDVHFMHGDDRWLRGIRQGAVLAGAFKWTSKEHGVFVFRRASEVELAAPVWEEVDAAAPSDKLMQTLGWVVVLPIWLALDWGRYVSLGIMLVALATLFVGPLARYRVFRLWRNHFEEVDHWKARVSSRRVRVEAEHADEVEELELAQDERELSAKSQ